MKSDDPSETAFLLCFLFKMAWPVWKAHKGDVPDTALCELEQRGDWPHGWANTIMQRITSDADLRKQLERW